MDDLISRQAAIDALRGYLVEKRCPDDGTLTCRLIENEVINKLPPIQPVNNSEMPNSSDVISRQAAIDATKKHYRAHDNDLLELIAFDIEQLPPIQPEPHWIPVTEMLPKESGLYQVTDMQGDVVRYVFNVNESSVEYWRRCVKAWMPLPEPFNGVTE